MLVITAIIDSITPFDWRGFVQDFLKPIRIFGFLRVHAELAAEVGVAPTHRRFKAVLVPVSTFRFAFAGTSDLHYYFASTTHFITPTLNPAKFISEIGVLPLGTPPCHSAKSSTAGTEHRVSLNLMSTDRQPRNQCYSRRLTPDPSSSRFFSHQSTRYPPAITLLICFSVWSE